MWYVTVKHYRKLCRTIELCNTVSVYVTKPEVQSYFFVKTKISSHKYQISNIYLSYKKFYWLDSLLSTGLF
jgi:hypothetical protein